MLYEYLPKYMTDYKEIKNILNIETSILSKLNSDINRVSKELFLETSESYGIDRIEKILDITASNEESNDYRKFRIKSIMLGIHQSLKEMLSTLIPNNDYTLSYNSNTMTMTLRLPVANEMYLTSVINMLQNTIPLNIKLDCSIAYTPHNEIKKYTHSQLKSYTHKYIKEVLYEQ